LVVDQTVFMGVDVDDKVVSNKIIDTGPITGTRVGLHVLSQHGEKRGPDKNLHYSNGSRVSGGRFNDMT
jgi:hypothetical protein